MTNEKYLFILRHKPALCDPIRQYYRKGKSDAKTLKQTYLVIIKLLILVSEDKKHNESIQCLFPLLILKLLSTLSI